MDPEASAPTAPLPTTPADLLAAFPSSMDAATTAEPIAIIGSEREATDAPRRSVTVLAPGFRFHPTDEELVVYYLKRKICRKSIRFNFITSVDIYKMEPWELPAKALVKTRDQEWYFFSEVDRKYSTGQRITRSTNEGYWKATGIDRVVRHDTRAVGLKKTLVYHYKQARDGKRTNWVMHEYRLTEEELNRCGARKDLCVLCRVFHKTNIGPPLGHRYAPFVEEEWEDEDVVLPGEEVEEEATAAEASKTEKELLSPEAVAVPHTDPPTETLSLLDVHRREVHDLSLALDIRVDTPPILENKRRKVAESNSKAFDCSDNSMKAPQGPWSSSKTTPATQEINQSSHLHAPVEYCLMESLQLKESSLVPRSILGASVLDSFLSPEYMRFITNLQEEVLKISMDKVNLQLDMVFLQARMNFLQSQLQNLTKENEQLKKKIQDG